MSRPEVPFIKNDEEARLFAIFVSVLCMNGVHFDVEDNREYWVVTLIVDGQIID